MAFDSILSEQFVAAAKQAYADERKTVLASGQSVIYRDQSGRLIQENQDGSMFEVRLTGSDAPEARVEVIGELAASR